MPQEDPKEWERDFANMAAAGFTVVRTGELLASWDYLEQEPGQPDFTSLDTAFALAAKHNLKLVLGTGACCPPAWLLAKYPDLAIVDRDGIAYPANAMWSWACINHPALLTESTRFLDQLLQRYGNNENLLAWQIHNEPGYPFIPREDRSKPAWYDYNAHTVEAFRKWLQEKYTDIETLNAAWRWIPTNLRFAQFADIPAPRAPASEWGAPQAWLDWRRFTYTNWNNFIAQQHAQIKQFSPQVLTMTNIYGAALDHDGRLGIDSWSLAEQCDVIGYDLYPGQQMPAPDRATSNANYPAWFLDFAASTAKHAGAIFWVPELESGPLAGWAAGPDYSTTPADIRRWGLQALGRGSKMVAFQGYRQWRSLPLNWGALVDWQGEATPRLEAAQLLAELIASTPQLITAKPVPATVAILHSQDNTLFNASCGLAEMVHAAQLGMHAKLSRLGFAVEFIAPQQLTREHGYAAIILPFQALLSSSTATALQQFVDNGGVVISLPRTGFVDENCQVWQQRPGGLTDVFGVTEVSIGKVAEIVVTGNFAGKEITTSGHHHQQQLHLADATTTLASFADGTAAVTLNEYGCGKAVHIATHLDLAPTDAANLTFWQAVLAQLGIKPEFILADEVELDCQLLSIDGGHLLFVANSTAKDIQTTIELPGIQIASLTKLWSIGKVYLVDGKLALSLPSGEALVVQLNN